MRIEIMTMPGLGESVTEATLLAWLVEVGDVVEKYESVAEVSSDKVTVEVPASVTGTVKKILVSEGDTVDINTPILELEVKAELENADSVQEDSLEVRTENIDGLDDLDKVESNHKEERAGFFSVDEVFSDIMESSSETEQAEGNYQSIQRSISGSQLSPVVATLIMQYNLDIEAIQGTGDKGRITKKDVEQYIYQHNLTKPSSGNQHLSFKKISTIEKSVREAIVHTPSAIRKTIAQRMVQSKQEIPHAWIMIEVDVTDLVEFRQSIKEDFYQQYGFNLTYFPFFLQAVAKALIKYPELNSSWQKEQIYQYPDINLSIAVAAEDGLYVPVIRNADQRSLSGLAQEAQRLLKSIQNGALTPDEMQGGTFTVNNTGALGSIQSMGIINYPQAAILQVESIRKELRVIEKGAFAVRDVVNLCLSIDHRVLDGSTAGAFLQEINNNLQQYTKSTSLY